MKLVACARLDSQMQETKSSQHAARVAIHRLSEGACMLAKTFGGGSSIRYAVPLMFIALLIKLMVA